MDTPTGKSSQVTPMPTLKGPRGPPPGTSPVKSTGYRLHTPLMHWPSGPQWLSLVQTGTQSFRGGSVIATSLQTQRLPVQASVLRQSERSMHG